MRGLPQNVLFLTFTFWAGPDELFIHNEPEAPRDDRSHDVYYALRELLEHPEYVFGSRILMFPWTRVRRIPRDNDICALLHKV